MVMVAPEVGTIVNYNGSRLSTDQSRVHAFLLWKATVPVAHEPLQVSLHQLPQTAVAPQHSTIVVENFLVPVGSIRFTLGTAAGSESVGLPTKRDRASSARWWGLLIKYIAPA